MKRESGEKGYGGVGCKRIHGCEPLDQIEGEDKGRLREA